MSYMDEDMRERFAHEREQKRKMALRKEQGRATVETPPKSEMTVTVTMELRVPPEVAEDLDDALNKRDDWGLSENGWLQRPVSVVLWRDAMPPDYVSGDAFRKQMEYDRKRYAAAAARARDAERKLSSLMHAVGALDPVSRELRGALDESVQRLLRTYDSVCES